MNKSVFLWEIIKIIKKQCLSQCTELADGFIDTFHSWPPLGNLRHSQVNLISRKTGTAITLPLHCHWMTAWSPGNRAVGTEYIKVTKLSHFKSCKPSKYTKTAIDWTWPAGNLGLTFGPRNRVWPGYKLCVAATWLLLCVTTFTCSRHYIKSWRHYFMFRNARNGFWDR